MAETIKVEIPVSVQDKTDPALSNISGKLSKLQTASTKASSSLSRLGKPSSLERSMERLSRMSITLHITATDDATPILHGVEDAAARANSYSVVIEADISDNVTDSTSEIGDSVSELNGQTANVEFNAESDVEEEVSTASDAISGFNGESAEAELHAQSDVEGEVSTASDALDEFNGETADAELGVNDNATEGINSAGDALFQFDGEDAVADLSAQDNATEVIHSAMDAGSEFDGSTFTATLQVADQARNSVDGVADRAVSGISGGMAAAAGFAGLSMGVGSAISTFGDFQAGMSQVAAISGATGDDLEALTAKAQEMGAKTKFTATQSAEAFNYMAMAGWKTGDMLDGIEGIMNLAAASGENLGTTSDIVTDAITAFGLTAADSTHFTDVLAKTSASANTNVSMMGESFKYIGPLAGAMGYSIEDVSLALGLMANAGVKSSMAGTSLRTAISNLAAPTDNMMAAMEKYGISLTDQEGNMKSLDEVMANVRDSLSGLAEDEQAAAVKTIFGKNAMSGMLAIINASEEDYQKLAYEIEHADGAAANMADTMLNNLSGKLTILGSAYEGVQNKFGSRVAPYLEKAVENITGLMPGLQTSVDDFFNTFDRRVKEMTGTKEWTEADFFGKVNIAWDKLIADPFDDWINRGGKEKISGAIGNLFGNAFKILPGGEEAGLTDWLSAGAIAIAGEKIIGTAAKITGALGSIHPAAGIAAGAIMGIVGAITLVDLAIDNLNQKKIKLNLDEHFGNVDLTDDEAHSLAGTIVPVDIVAELHTSSVKFEESEDLISKAEQAIATSQAINFKAGGVKWDLDKDDLETLQENAKTIRKDLMDAMKLEEEGSEEFVNAIMGGTDAADVINKMREWFAEDSTEVSTLGNSVSDLLQRSIEDGVMNVNTAAAAQLLQQKMLEMTTGAQSAKLQGKLDMLSIMQNGAALNEESWANVVSYVGELEQEYNTYGQDAFENVLSHLAQAVQNDPSRQGEADRIKEMIGQAWMQQQTQVNGQVWDWLYTSMQNSYGEEISGGQAIMNDEGIDYVGQFLNGTGSGVGLVQGQSQIFGREYGADTQGALLDRYKKMMPTVEELQEIIDNSTGPVPQMIMDSYNQAMELGAMAGDESAMSQFYANQIAAGFENMDAFQAALKERGMDFSDLAPTFQEGLKRAFTETTENVDYSNMMQSLIDSLSGQDVDWSQVESLVNEYGYTLGDGVENGEIELQKIDVTADEVGTEENRADLLNKTQEFIDSFDAGGVTPTITESGVEVSFEDVQVAAESVGQSVEEYCSNYNIDAGELEATGTVTISPDNINMSMVKAAVEEEATATEGESFDVGAEANVEMTQTNNALDVSNQVQSDIDNAINEYTTSAGVTVTLEWHIANPTASISVGVAGGTATATIASAAMNANGSFVDGPLLSWVGEDGPEYIIPVGADKHSRGMELWAQAGEALGVPGFADGGLVGGYAPTGTVNDDYVPVNSGSGSVPVSTNGQNAPAGNISVNVGAPVINISSDNPQDVMQIINDNFDDLMANVADRLAEVYEATPVVA